MSILPIPSLWKRPASLGFGDDVKAVWLFTTACKAVLLAIVGAAPLVAEPLDRPPPALVALVQTAGYQNNIARLFSLLPSDVFHRCPALVSTGSTVTIVQPVTFASDGYPLSGLWKQIFPVSGCGNDTTINLFFRGQPNEIIESTVGVAGATHADLTLQRDALVYVNLAVRAVVPECSDLHVRTSTYDGRAPIDPKRGWLETWTIAACGHSYRVPLSFIPDATGTVITAKTALQIAS